jgi:hypothetical protein
MIPWDQRLPHQDQRLRPVRQPKEVAMEPRVAQWIRLSKRITQAAGYLELDLPETALQRLDQSEAVNLSVSRKLFCPSGV